MMARPTGCTREQLDKAREYLNGGFLEQKQHIPTSSGLALYLGVARTTPYNWAQSEDNPNREELALILDNIQATQEVLTVNKSLVGEFNPTVSVRILANHGYSDKQAFEHSSPDGSMSPTRIEIVAADDQDRTD